MNIYKMIEDAEKALEKQFKIVDEICFLNSKKVIDAFHKVNLSEMHLNGTTGYGYSDVGREAIDKIYSYIFKCEKALCRAQFISGTHALCVTLFGLLRPNDILLSISSIPYDTLQKVIGINESEEESKNSSSLKSFNIKYEQIDLIDNDFDFEKIEERVKKQKELGKIKVIEIQKSRGYSTRDTLSNEKVEKVIKLIKKLDPTIIVMVDNCYCEFVSEKEPTEIGADIVVGSLIKNLGGGIATNGAYVAGKERLVNLVAERLTVPGQGDEVGATGNMNREILMGLYHAPQGVASAVKISILSAYILEKLGYVVSPKYFEKRNDTVIVTTFKNAEDLINYTQGIQQGSAIDAHFLPEPTDMPGYDDKIIMASGSFISGSTAEISCDGPLRYPFNAYQQGSLTYDYGKIALTCAIDRLLNNKKEK